MATALSPTLSFSTPLLLFRIVRVYQIYPFRNGER